MCTLYNMPKFLFCYTYWHNLFVVLEVSHSYCSFAWTGPLQYGSGIIRNRSKVVYLSIIFVYLSLDCSLQQAFYHVSFKNYSTSMSWSSIYSLQNVAFIVPPVVVFILAIIFLIFGAWLIYRARRGYFFCCKPVSMQLCNEHSKMLMILRFTTGFSDQTRPNQVY